MPVLKNFLCEFLRTVFVSVLKNFSCRFLKTFVQVLKNFCVSSSHVCCASSSELFVEFLRKNNVHLGKNVDTLKILTTEAEIAKWSGQGLPSDRVSSENGAIMTNSQRWCLIIDPQLQGIGWIKNKEASNSLQITRMGHPKMVATFEVSLDTGKSVIIENMGESVDAVLAPVIAVEVHLADVHGSNNEL